MNNRNSLCLLSKEKTHVKHILRVMKIISFCLFFMVFCLNAATLKSQNVLVTVNMKEVQLSKLLNEIEKQTDYLFVYETNVDMKQKVSVDANRSQLKDVLNKVFEKTNIVYTTEGSNIILKTNNSHNVAQQSKKTIKGRIKDVHGDPVIGASIAIKGTTTGTLSDIDGNFSLSIPEDTKMLTCTYVGMKPQDISVVNKTAIDIVMEDASIAMTEVVVTALGIKKEAKSLSYNVQQLKASDVNKVTDANFVNNLNGKIAGVTINSSASGVGGSSRVVMRGSKSITGNNNALYVIDGIPMPNLSSGQPDDIFSGAGQTGDGISNINPDDIESISVLSGPSAAALYGTSAANGAILVTTKKGEANRVSINLSNSTLFSRPLILPELQNKYGSTAKGSYYSWGDKLSTPSDYDVADFFNTGVNVSNSASLSTGTENSQTYVSVGTVNSKGIIENNNYDRYNFSARNTSSMFNKKLTMDIGFMASKVKEQNMTSQGTYFNPLVPLYLFPAGDDFSKVQVYERYNPSRNFKTQFWDYDDLGMAAQNPYWIVNRAKFGNKKNRYMLNGSLRYKFEEWINVSGRVKYDQSFDKFEKKFGASTNKLFASDTGYYSKDDKTTTQTYGEVMLNINKYLNDGVWGITANIGASFQNVDFDQSMYGGKLQDSPNVFSFNNVAGSTAERVQSAYKTRNKSLFASSQIGYKSMAYLDVTARNDWPSSLAGTNTSSFFYPSVGLSGIITEIFNIQSNAMPYMKVRVSYSEVGNEPIWQIAKPSYLTPNGTPNTITQMANPDLKPELTKSWEAGLNFMFFKNKLKLDATVYSSKTRNQIFQPELAPSSGFTSMYVNGGRVDNKGVELSLRFNDTYGDFDWGTFLTYSLNRNTIKELLKDWKNPMTGEITSYPTLEMGGTGSVKTVLTEGGSMGDIYVNTLRTDEHGAIYVNPSDQTVLVENNNFVYAGNTSPKYNLGWGGNASWKGFSLSFMFNARVGGTVVSNTQAVLDAFGASKASADARDAGGALVNGKLIPAMPYYQTIGGGTSGVGSMYCYSATNVRLGEATLGYNVPITKWVGWVKGLNVTLTGRNLFFLYRKAPFDPELSASTGTYYQGIDYFMAPSQRNIGFAVKLQF